VELEIAERQIVAKAECIPAEPCNWRPVTLAEPRSVRTRIEREFDPEVVRGLKADVRHDITVDGPELAAHALRAGLVDELQMIVCPVVVGAGKRFFPDRVRLKLGLVNERRFRHGVVVLRYTVRGFELIPWHPELMHEPQ
jgi:dihydrofolate reductase